MKLRSTIFPLLIAAPFIFATPGDLPAGCADGGTTGEGFPVAHCRDGSVWYRDMDGQVYENEAGNPVYAPGTWVEIQ
jgi:hypothetical protein